MTASKSPFEQRVRPGEAHFAAERRKGPRCQHCEHLPFRTHLIEIILGLLPHVTVFYVDYRMAKWQCERIGFAPAAPDTVATLRMLLAGGVGP